MVRRQHPRVLAVLAAVVLVSAASADASVFLKESIGSLRKQAEAVVHGTVLDVRSYWNAEGSMIFTDVALEVKGNLHGRVSDPLIIRVPGGTVGGFTAEMEGAPRIEVGEEVVAFIGRWDDGEPMVAGYFQGLSRVERDKLGNAVLKGGVANGLTMSELTRRLGPSGR